MTVSAIIPAYNEAENIALVVSGLLALRKENGLPLIDEVVVADNNSTDDTAEIACKAGARVISVLTRGYGSACAAACEFARGDVLLFVDGDHTADLAQTPLLLNEIDLGAELVIGARANAIHGSLTLPQRFGNAFACALIRLIWRVPVTDLGPFRAITRSAYVRVGMRDRAYGWTIEMQVRAAQLGMRVCEVQITWLPRHAGHSKVSGTVRGVFGAGFGILSTIARLWWREQFETSRPTPSAAPAAGSVAAAHALGDVNPYQLSARLPAETDCSQ